MRVHHLNCVSHRPPSGRLMGGRTRSNLQRGRLAGPCQLIETDRGLVLIDTGHGLRDVRAPRGRSGAHFLGVTSQKLTAVGQS